MHGIQKLKKAELAHKKLYRTSHRRYELKKNGTPVNIIHFLRLKNGEKTLEMEKKETEKKHPYQIFLRKKRSVLILLF